MRRSDAYDGLGGPSVTAVSGPIESILKDVSIIPGFPNSSAARTAIV